MTTTNISVLQKMIEYRRTMLTEPCFDSQTITQILRQAVGTNQPHDGGDPYQQLMNMYRRNLFQAADDSVRVSRRRRAFVTLQRLNQAMDARVRVQATTNRTNTTLIPAPLTSIVTPCYKSRDEPSTVSLETTDRSTMDDIPHSVMMPSSPSYKINHKPARRISLPQVVDCCDEGIL